MGKPIICVLGMHRSGTSCLAGTLEQAGVHLGDVSVENPFNAKGNRENEKVLRLHKDLMHANGGSWYKPPRRIRWSDSYRRRRDDIIQEYAHHLSWGFKDPRTLLTLEGWLEALPTMQLVGIFRRPLAVAQSLQTRNGFSLRKGFQLWHRYNERLLAFARHFRFPVLSFDLHPDAFQLKLHFLFRLLDLRADLSKLDFFDPRLKHDAPADERALPRYVKTLYQRLQETML